jgi:hypothetical protein
MSNRFSAKGDPPGSMLGDGETREGCDVARCKVQRAIPP